MSGAGSIALPDRARASLTAHPATALRAPLAGVAEAVHAERVLQADDGALGRLQEGERKHERERRPQGEVQPERRLEAGLGHQDEP